MAELRRDPLVDRWVILAPGRAERPRSADERRPAAADDRTADCPFCPGHEHRTPPEVARRGPGAPDRPGWRVRIVPNRYPIVHGPPGEATMTTDPLRRSGTASGAHEVAVLSPDHDRSLAHLDDEQVVDVLAALRDRSRAHAAAGHRYTQVMVNHGAGGGASLVHPHAQLVAIDVAPPTVIEELVASRLHGRCVICSELQRHDSDRSLVVISGDAELWCPWWSATAYELLLAPRLHRPRFEDADTELRAVATTLRDGLLRLDRAAGDPPYNVVVHSRPADRDDDYHWHIHIRPRLQREAGFEMGTGILVNTVDPSEAAASLR